MTSGTTSETDLTSFRVAAGEMLAGSDPAPVFFGYVYGRAKHNSVSTGHDGGHLFEPAGGRKCRSSTFRFTPSIAIIPAGRGPVPSHGLESATGEEMIAA